MKARDKSGTPAIDRAIGNAVNFEITLADMARRSERRAWTVAICAVVMSLILAGGYFIFLPLKQKVPYLVMADAYTGTATVARLAGDFNKNSITASDAINRSNVAHFVLARESYDYALIQLRDWTTVYTMSAPNVAAEYSALHSPRNADSPFNSYGQAQAIRVKILSIQLIGGSDGAMPKGATVRFQRSVLDKPSAQSKPLDSRIATLEFLYKTNLSMDEKDRIENPLGFQVTSYRVDNDYAAAPPVDMVTDAPIPALAPAPAAMAPSAPPALPVTAVPADTNTNPAAASVPAPAAAPAPVPTTLPTKGEARR
jgi:type IV secretion system protein VirB8